MKKFSGKVFAGIFAAAVMASAAFVTASAADYAVDPDWQKPTAGNVAKSDVDAAIKAADKTVEIDAKDSTGASLDKASVAALKEANMPVEVELKNCTVTIPAKSLGDDALTIGVGVNTATAATKVGEVSVPKDSVLIQPDFGTSKGFEVTVTVNVPDSITANNAKLYHVDDKGVATEVKDALKVNEDGTASITISHASYYVITDGSAVESAKGSDNVNTGVTLPIALVALAGGSVAVSAIAAKKRK